MAYDRNAYFIRCMYIKQSQLTFTIYVIVNYGIDDDSNFKSIIKVINNFRTIENYTS